MPTVTDATPADLAVTAIIESVTLRWQRQPSPDREQLVAVDVLALASAIALADPAYFAALAHGVLDRAATLTLTGPIGERVLLADARRFIASFPLPAAGEGVR